MTLAPKNMVDSSVEIIVYHSTWRHLIVTLFLDVIAHVLWPLRVTLAVASGISRHLS